MNCADKISAIVQANDWLESKYGSGGVVDWCNL
jgi:hypothetical protein